MADNLEATNEQKTIMSPGDDDDASNAASSRGENEETVEELLARHRKEIKNLQAEEISLKKQAAKGSKAEQKAKKKAIDEKIALLDWEMKARHEKELAALGFGMNSAAANDSPGVERGSDTIVHHPNSDVDAIAMAIAGVKTNVSGSTTGRVSKAQMRKNKKMLEEKEREQRIQDEKSNTVSEREVENLQLHAKLSPLGLTIREVKPDGHCLYRAVEDQLTMTGSLPLPSAPPQDSGHLAIRSLVADYMRSHADDFLPFISTFDLDSVDPSSDAREMFERYCHDVEKTAAWGGQVELRAAALALRRHVVVISADQPDVEMGLEFSKTAASHLPIRVSYHRHAYSLGEHYNSVVPLSGV